MAFIMDDINEMRKIASQTGNSLKKLDARSFAARAKDSIFQFPCLVADSIPVDMSTTLVNYIEPVYASWVQTCLSRDSRINLGTTNIDQWLQKNHQNVRLESVVSEPEPEDVFGIFESAYNGNSVIYHDSSDSVVVGIQYTTEHGAELMRQNKEMLNEYMSAYDLKPLYEAPGDLNNSDIMSAYLSGQRDKNQRAYDQKEKEIVLKNTVSQRAPQLLDRDVKKLNNMMPYGIEVKLMAIDDNGNLSNFVTIIVGVKAVLHLLKSNEMIENIGRGMKTKGFLMNLVRFTSGEISFMKDFVLHLDDIKLDVSNMSKGYSSWFPTLKRMKDRKIQLKAFSAQRLVPNATVVISSYELQEIERKFGFNLKDTRFAKKLISDYFLMSFIVIDDATQTVDILLEKDPAFQTYALETLEREVNLNSNRLGKEIGRMISR